MKKKVYDSENTPHEDRNPPIFMPFLYNVYDKKTASDYVKTLVCVARWDLSPYDHAWWGTDSLAGNFTRVLQPDVDIVVEAYEFTGSDGVGECEAIEFIRQWWVEHPMKKKDGT